MRTALNALRGRARLVAPVLAGPRPSLLLDMMQGVLDPRVQFSRAGNATRIGPDGRLELVAANVPRFDHDPSTRAPLGLLLEDQRTNQVVNSTFAGAAIGSTAPTSMSFNTQATGVAITCVGVGTEDGLAYVDVRYSGTATVAGHVWMDLFGWPGVAAATGQAWTASIYVRRLAGSDSLRPVQLWLHGRDSAGSGIEGPGINLAPIAAGPKLSANRVVLTHTMANANTVRAHTNLRMGSVQIGDVIDVTYRIAAPQLEQGAFATSHIPTSGTAATRASEACWMSGAGWLNDAGRAGTLFVEATMPFTGITNIWPSIAAIGDGTSFNRVFLYLAGNTGTNWAYTAIGDNNGTREVNNLGSATNVAHNLPMRGALAYSNNDVRICANSGVVAQDTSFTVPPMDRLVLGNTTTSGANIARHIRRVAYYQTALNAQMLRRLTT